MAVVAPVDPTKKKSPWGDGFDQYAETEQGVLGDISKGLQGPSDSVRSMISSGDEAVAQKARSMQGAAGARAAASGSFGQGTASGLAEDADQSILSQISQNARDNTKAVGDEHQQYLSRAQAMLGQGTQEQGQQQQQSQFDTTNARDNKQLDQQQQQFVQGQISDLAKTNPVLASKYTQFMLNGGQGSMGDFTPDEQKQLSAWVDSNKEMDDLTKNALKSQLTTISGNASSAANAQKFSSKPLSESDFTTGDGKAYADSLPVFSPTQFGPEGPDHNKAISEWATTNQGKDVTLNGHVYRIVGPQAYRSGADTDIIATDEHGKQVQLNNVRAN